MDSDEFLWRTVGIVLSTIEKQIFFERIHFLFKFLLINVIFVILLQLLATISTGRLKKRKLFQIEKLLFSVFVLRIPPGFTWHFGAGLLYLK